MRYSDPKPTILLVDDNRTDLEIISILCRAQGCEVELAADGLEAVDLYRKRSYQVVLIDYEMEPIDGISVASRIKEINPDAICLMVTGSPNKEVRRFSEEGGVDDLIIKPIQAAEIKESLRIALNKSRGATKKITGVALSNRMDNCSMLVEDSPRVSQNRKEIAATIESQNPLLIADPHGAGKHEIVRFIHDHGPHAGRQIVEVQCAARDEESLRRDLIGEGGAWNSLLREAEGSTLVLDQILSLPLLVQKDLASEFARISSKMLVIALSDDSLEDGLEQGLIDDEFYFKVSMEQIDLPSTNTGVSP